MIREINVQDLAKLSNPVLVDVRSEGEFAEATIPGAINLPLFNNEERAQVGTAYTQVSPARARELGLSLVSPKLPSLVKEAEKLAEQGSLVMFCWRGGMRSKAFSQVLDLMGIPVYRLIGGYKAYRKQVVDYFQGELPFHVVVLRGNTGVGKTEMLGRLRQHGYPAIDLEGLANNRGSVFGDVGLGTPPSQKDFEGLLYEELLRFKDWPYIVVECESKRIGRVTLPQSFFQAMQAGTQILMYASLDIRVKRLRDEYTAMPEAFTEIRQALQRLVKTLGHAKVAQLNELLEKDEEEFTRRLLVDYYDPLYAYPNAPDPGYALCLNYSYPKSAIRELEEYLDKRLGSAKPEPTLSGVRNTTE